MKLLNNFLIMVFILLVGINEIYAGAGNRTGTGGASQLLIPVGARGIAMGSANAATATGIEALFWNPAGVAKLNNSADVMFSHMDYIADIGVEYGAVSANFEGFGVLSLSVKSLSIGEIAITTVDNPDGTGRTFSPQNLIAGITYSKQLTERIAVGVTANFVTETLADVSSNGVAFNVGVVYDNLASISGLSFGVVMKNIGPKMKFGGSGLLIQADAGSLSRPPQFYSIESAAYELPSTFELGFGYQPKLDEMNSLLISTSFQNNNFSSDEYKVGLEYGYNNMFFIRGGYSAGPQNTNDFIYGFTAGAGINYNFESLALRVDYAYRDTDFFDGNHIFSIAFGF